MNGEVSEETQRRKEGVSEREERVRGRGREERGSERKRGREKEREGRWKKEGCKEEEREMTEEGKRGKGALYIPGHQPWVVSS